MFNSSFSNIQVFEKKVKTSRFIILVFLAIDPLLCILEIIGSVPKLSKVFLKDIKRIEDLLGSSKEEVREFAAVLHAIVVNELYRGDEFDGVVNRLLAQTGCKSLEAQHGAILGGASALETQMLSTKEFNSSLLKNCLNTIGK